MVDSAPWSVAVSCLLYSPDEFYLALKLYPSSHPYSILLEDLFQLPLLAAYGSASVQCQCISTKQIVSTLGAWEMGRK